MHSAEICLGFAAVSGIGETVDMLKRHVPLVIVCALVMLACTKNQRTDTLRGAIVTINGTRDAWLQWDRQHQDEIIDAAKAKKLTKAEVSAELVTYYQARQPLENSFVEVYNFLLFAAAVDDDKNLTTAIEGVRTLIETIANFKKHYEGRP